MPGQRRGRVVALVAMGTIAGMAGMALSAEGTKGMPRRSDPRYSQALAGVRFCSPIACGGRLKT